MVQISIGYLDDEMQRGLRGVRARMNRKLASQLLRLAVDANVLPLADPFPMQLTRELIDDNWPSMAENYRAELQPKIVAAYKEKSIQGNREYGLGVIAIFLLEAVAAAVVQWLVTWWLDHHIHRQQFAALVRCRQATAAQDGDFSCFPAGPN